MRVFQKLPLLNILRRPMRSIALLCLIALLSFTIFGGAVMTAGLRNGVESLELRLGADIMVVPKEAGEKAGLESIVLQGNTTYFYMDDTKLDEVSAIDGIDQITTQLYLASLAASCCSAKVQLMGFDPATDFTIQPWIRDTYSRDLGKMDIVVGSDIVSSEGDRLLFYDTPCNVVAKLSKTGTNYDRCVFAGEDTIRTLTESSVGKNLNQFKDIDPNHVISCILINVKDGVDIDEVAAHINESVDGVTALRTRSLISGTARSLAGISRIIRIAIIIVFVLAFIILIIAFTMLIHERRREFATLRVLGVSKGALARSVMSEIVLLCLAGGLTGAGIAAVVTVPFSGALQGWLDMPMLMPGAGTLLVYLLLAVVVCVGAGILASVWNVLRVSRADISLSLREGK